MVHETNQIVLPDDTQGILRKDAVYNAVSLAAFDLYDEVSFKIQLMLGFTNINDL